jgi:predicted PurR-regulated permease PerM
VTEPHWRARADAWFKVLGAVALGYLILQRIVFFLNDFREVTVIAVGGMLVAYLVLPLVRALNRRLPLWAALTVVYVGTAALIAGFAWLLAPTIVQQFQALVAALPAMRGVLERYLSTTNSPIVAHLPEPVRAYVGKIPEQLSGELQAVALSVSSRVVPAIVSVVNVLVLAVAIPIVSIYMLAESGMAKRFIARIVPPERRDQALSLLEEIDEVFGGFVRGQLLVALSVAVLAIIALAVLHVPYALLIGAWAGLADVVPYVGPFAGAIPAALVAGFSNGWPNALAVIAAFVAINQIEAHLLGPRIVSSTVKVSPLTVIFALLIGGHMFGFLGLLIAVPIAGVIRVILVHLFPEREVTNAEVRPSLTQAPRDEVDPTATKDS